MKLIIFILVLIIGTSSTIGEKQKTSRILTELAQVTRIPSLVSLEKIINGIKLISGLDILGILEEFQATLQALILYVSNALLDFSRVFFGNNKLVTHVAVNTIKVINGAVAFTQKTVVQAVDILGWMLSVGNVMEELQPMIIGVVVGTFLVPTFLEGLALSLIEIVAESQAEASEQLQLIFKTFESNVTADINHFLDVMVPGKSMALVGE